MHVGSHPCGALPVSGFSLGVWYCHHHQAFFAHASGYEERAKGVLDPTLAAAVEFGPFDTLEDVHGWIRRSWDAWRETHPDLP
jgi:hypothetical protein